MMPEFLPPRLSPSPTISPVPAGARPRNLQRRQLLGGLLAIALLSFGAFKGSGALLAVADEVDAQQIATMQADWQRATTEGIAVQTVTPDQVEAAISTMKLPPDRARALLADIRSGRQDLIWITVWDSIAQDGDTIGLASNGVRTAIRLTHAPQTIALPRPADGVVLMDGVFDGGGGITVGIASGASQALIPPFQPGATLGVPVR